MRLAIDTLKLENFRSFRQPAVLDLRELGPGLIYVDGDNQVDDLQSNGAGKSTLWAALEWCLYGTTGDGLLRTDVKPWTNGGEPKVTASFRRDNEALVVERVGTAVTMNGRPASAASIINFLMPPAVAMNALILGQGRPLFLDLTPRDKLDIFTMALDLARWDRRSAAASARAKTMTLTAASLAGEVRAAEARLAADEDALARVQEDAEQWQRSEQQRVSYLKDGIDEATTRLAKTTAIIEAAELSADEAGTQLKLLRPDQTLLAGHIGQRRGMDHMLGVQIATLKEEHKQLANLSVQALCPTCGQQMNPATLREHLKTLRGEISKREAEIKKLGLPKLERQLSDLVKQIETREHAYAQAQAVLDLQRSQQAMARAHIEAMKREAQVLTNPYLGQVDTLHANIITATELLDKTKANAGLAERRAVRATFWVKGFQDIKLDLVDDVLAEMQMAGNAMLPAIGLDGWMVDYASDKETKAGTITRGIHATVRSPHNPEAVKWAAWSGGERQRLRLVGALALSEVLLANAGIDAGFEVLDEPCDHLSPGGVDAVVEFLADRAVRLGRQIFFADQNSLQSGRFSAVVRVRKDQAGSTLEVEAL